VFRIEYPLSVPFLPSTPDERSRQAVAVLREVISEPTFHARRALIRRVLLDPWALHVDDLLVLHLKIDLASHAAVWTHAPNGAIENREMCGDVTRDVSVAGVRRAIESAPASARGRCSAAVACERVEPAMVAVAVWSDLRLSE
jgi:hypothetical protein